MKIKLLVICIVLLSLMGVAWTPVTHTVTVYLAWDWGHKGITNTTEIIDAHAGVKMRHDQGEITQFTTIPDWEVVYNLDFPTPMTPPTSGLASSPVTLTFILPYTGTWEELFLLRFESADGVIHYSHAGDYDIVEGNWYRVDVLQVEEENECPVDPPPPTVYPTATNYPTPPLCPTETPPPTETSTPTPLPTATDTPTLTSTPTSTLTPTATPTTAVTCVPTMDWQDQSTYTPVPPPPICVPP